MIRHESLIPLSWDHHKGLVLAARLRKGLEKKANPKVMKEYLLHFWDEHLSDHFHKEETLIPSIAFSRKTGESSFNMNDDHDQLSELIDQIRSESENLDVLLEKFAKELKNHIRYEERHLFPFIEQNMESNTLETIGNILLNTHSEADPSWREEFWK